MLRALVLIVGALCLGAGLVSLFYGAPPGFVFIFWGVVIVVGIVFERVVYKPLRAGSPGPGWEKTTERFVDDATGQMVTVYVQPKTGERAYVKE